MLGTPCEGHNNSISSSSAHFLLSMTTFVFCFFWGPQSPFILETSRTGSWLQTQMVKLEWSFVNIKWEQWKEPNIIYLAYFWTSYGKFIGFVMVLWWECYELLAFGIFKGFHWKLRQHGWNHFWFLIFLIFCFFFVKAPLKKTNIWKFLSFYFVMFYPWPTHY